MREVHNLFDCTCSCISNLKLPILGTRFSILNLSDSLRTFRIVRGLVSELNRKDGKEFRQAPQGDRQQVETRFTAPSQFSRKLSAADSQESRSTNRRCLSSRTIFHCVCRSRYRRAVSYLPTGHRATQSPVRSPAAIHFPEPPTIRRRFSCDTSPSDFVERGAGDLRDGWQSYERIGPIPDTADRAAETAPAHRRFVAASFPRRRQCDKRRLWRWLQTNVCCLTDQAESYADKVHRRRASIVNDAGDRRVLLPATNSRRH